MAEAQERQTQGHLDVIEAAIGTIIKNTNLDVRLLDFCTPAIKAGISPTANEAIKEGRDAAIAAIKQAYAR